MTEQQLYESAQQNLGELFQQGYAVLEAGYMPESQRACDELMLIMEYPYTAGRVIAWFPTADRAEIAAHIRGAVSH